MPLWIATGFTLINFFFVALAFPETGRNSQNQKMSVRLYLSNIRKALDGKRVKSMYTIYFLFLFAWTLVLQFVPVLMVRHFHFTNSNLGDLALFMGVCWALGSSYLNHILMKWMSSIKIMEGCLSAFTLLCILIIFPMHIYNVLAVMAGCVIVGGLAWPHCNGMISSAAPAKMQGKFMGLTQSLQSLAMGIAPAVGGIAYQLFSGFPFLLGAIASLSAGIVYFSLYNVKK